MMPQARTLDRRAVLVMLVLCASWGFNQVTAKLALADIPPLTQAAMRSVGATLLLGAWGLWSVPKLFARDGTLWPGLLAGAAFGAEFVLLYLGLQWTSAGHAILFLYTAPFFVAIGLVWVTPNERLSALQWSGLVLSFIGVALALGLSGAVSRAGLMGDGLALAAGALWAATTLVVKGSRLLTAPPVKVLLYQVGTSVVILTTGAVVSGEPWPTHVSALTIACMVYQTVWIVGVTFLVWFWLISAYRAGELSAFTFITPPIGVAAGWLVLHERIEPSFAAAVGCVAAGLLLVTWPRRA